MVGSIRGTCRFYDASGTSFCDVMPMCMLNISSLPQCLILSYDCVGKHLKLDVKIRIQGRKKTSANKITGIQVCFTSAVIKIIPAVTYFVYLWAYSSLQFCQERSQRVMITSEDSKVRVYDGIDLVQKYRGRADFKSLS